MSQDHATEEPYDAKVSRTVLQPGGSGDRPAEVNHQGAGTCCETFDTWHGVPEGVSESASQNDAWLMELCNSGEGGDGVTLGAKEPGHGGEELVLPLVALRDDDKHLAGRELVGYRLVASFLG